MSKGMFTELMETSSSDERPVAKPRKKVQSPAPIPPLGDQLPAELEELSNAGYNSHSYRLSETEIRWFRRFCLRASERVDRHISHNTLFRALLRLADEEWKSNPDGNRLLKLLSRIK